MPIDEDGLALCFGDIRDAVESDVVDEYVADAKRLTPFKTGQLRESIHKVRVGPNVWQVRVTAPWWAAARLRH